MDGVEPKVGEERFAAIVLDESHGLIDDLIAMLRILRPVPSVGIVIRELVTEQFAAKALCSRRVVAIAQVPLSSEEDGVARVTHGLGDGKLLQSEILLVRRRQEFAGNIISNVRRDPKTRRILPREDAASRR